MVRPPQRVTPLLLDILAVLLEYPRGIHGYAILQGLPRRADGGRHQSGAVYPVINKIVDAGWASREWQRLETGGPAQRVVRLTDDLGRPGADALVTKSRLTVPRPRGHSDQQTSSPLKG